MKRLFISMLIILFSISSAGAYNEGKDFILKKNKYKLIMQKQVVGKIKKMSVRSQERLVDILINKITQIEKSTSMSEEDKIQRLSMFHALKEIVKGILLTIPVVNIPGETV